MFKKIWEPERQCLNPEHKPPGMIVLEGGTYEYTCPSCGEVTVVNVPIIAM